MISLSILSHWFTIFFYLIMLYGCFQRAFFITPVLQIIFMDYLSLLCLHIIKPSQWTFNHGFWISLFKNNFFLKKTLLYYCSVSWTQMFNSHFNKCPSLLSKSRPDLGSVVYFHIFSSSLQQTELSSEVCSAHWDGSLFFSSSVLLFALFCFYLSVQIRAATGYKRISAFTDVQNVLPCSFLTDVPSSSMLLAS